ncbi:MAG: alpha-ribazole phosphatase [Planctomycetes bacterium]|nr:alpha-ribazole phosphatase [Planctomycetota bacterium]
MKQLYLVRHGVTALNEQRRYCGINNVGLAEKGLKQAQLVGQLFIKSNVSSAFTSPLKRCLETSNAISLSHDIPTEPLAGLSEIDFGLWEGLTFEDIQATYPDQLKEWFANPESFTFPEGESVCGFRKRVLGALEEIIQQRENCLIVAHGGSLRVIICHLCGWPVESMHSFELGHGSLTILNHYGESTVVKVLNNTCHLRNGGVS